MLESFDRDGFVNKLHCHFPEFEFGPLARELVERIARFYLRNEPKDASPLYYLQLTERVGA